MSMSLTPEQVAIIIRARRLLKEKGLSPDTDVKTLCGEVGISRKTGVISGKSGLTKRRITIRCEKNWRV